MRNIEFNIGSVRFTGTIGEIFQQFWSKQFLRYFAVALVALAGDAGLLLVLVDLVGLDVTFSTATAFLFGAMINYYLSIRLVFQSRVLAKDPVLELMTFVAIGLIGVGITELTIHVLYIGVNLPLIIAKFLAAGLTFLFNYFFRKVFLFTARSMSNE